MPLGLPSSSNVDSVKEILRKTFERMVPATLSYIAGTHAGYAASVLIFTTWMLAKMRKRIDPIEKEETLLIDLSKKIEQQESKVRMLRQALKPGDVVAESALKIEEEILEKLKEEYKLAQLRILAYRKLLKSGNKELLKQVEKMIDKMKKGKDFTSEQLKVLNQLEREWQSKAIEESVLLRILEVG